MSAASVDAAPLITQLDASTQLPADAAPQVQNGIQPEPVMAAEPNTPPAEQPVQQDALPTQLLFLPLVSN